MRGIQWKLTIPSSLYQFINAHAFRRDVSRTRLAEDVLTCWVRRATPMNDPIFAPDSIGHSMPILKEEPFPGYFASLRFLPEIECQQVDFNEAPAYTKAERAIRFPDE